MGLAHDLLAVHRTYGFRTTTRLVAAEAKRLAVNQTLRRSFSQAYEDRFAWELLDRPTGFYVDIGCHDPVRLSDTYRLYRKGWSGLAVDASPEFAERFARLRPRDRFVNVGVGEGSRRSRSTSTARPRCRRSPDRSPSDTWRTVIPSSQSSTSRS